MSALRVMQREQGVNANTAAPDDDDVRKIVVAAKAGSQQAFTELVERYNKRAYWVAYNLVGKEQDAIDITQEAFIRVFKSLHRFDENYRFYTWFYRIVTNLAVDHLRKHRKRSKVSLNDVGDLDSDAPSAYEHVRKQEVAGRVRHVLDRLPTPYRTAMVLRELEGFTAKEVADIVDSTHATVRWRLHRARELFRVEWQKLYGLEETGDGEV